MTTIIKEFFIVALLFGVIKIIMVVCRPADELISSITLKLGRSIIYAATAVVILPKKAAGKFDGNAIKNNDMPFSKKITKFLKGIAAEFVKLSGIVYMHNKVDYNICPNCFTKYNEPRYVCPNCGTAYYSLEPSSNGVLSIECSCGHKIPVTAFGKRKLKTLCPTCGNENPLPEIPSFVIVVIGGEGSGKSTFMENSSLRKISTEKETFYETITENEKGREKHVMVVETEGKDFTSSESLKKHRYYEYNSGFIFIIDSFAVTDTMNFIKPNYVLSDVLDTTILNLQKNYNLKPGEMIKKPTAFVLVKNDMLDDVNKGKEPEKLLVENGEEVFLNKIYNSFTKYKFFKTGLGRNDNLEIIKWITRNM
ncbi:hypothetical protein ACJDT4_18920 [Clostridium neuense]|uniref:Double zinc ribbon n=1 Tax=Clostridium neuense TaxID=1728934 RepID=A0ABW8TLV4_9CLOT